MAIRRFFATLLNPLRWSVSRKILTVVGLVGALSFLGIGMFAIQHLERSLLAEHETANTQLLSSARVGLQAIMASGYADIAEDYARGLKEIEGLADFRILRSNGLLAFQDNATIDNINERTGAEEFMPRDEVRQVRVLDENDANLQKVSDEMRTVTYFETDANGENFKNYLTPLENQERCARCHGNDHPVRGVMWLKVAMAPIEQNIAVARTKLSKMMLAATAAFLLLLGLYLRVSVAGPLKRISRTVQNIARGDLTTRVPVRSRAGDDVVEMGRDVNTLADNLSHTIKLIGRESQGLNACVGEFISVQDGLNASADASYKITANVVNLNADLEKEIQGIHGAVREAAIDVVSDSLDTLAGNIDTIAGASEEASRSVGVTAQLAHAMSGDLDDVNTKLADIDRAVTQATDSLQNMDASFSKVRERCLEATQRSGQAAENAASANQAMQELATSAREIGTITNLINEVARKTNLLSLNAAIEAAKAGDAGRGFSVVASEVKALAQETLAATKVISRAIENIRGTTADATGAVDNFAATISLLDGVNTDINQAVDRQSNTTGEIARFMNGVHDGTQKVVANARDLGRSAAEINSATTEAAARIDEIAQLSCAAASGAANVATKTTEARASIMQILQSAGNAGALSEVIVRNMRLNFDHTADNHNLVTVLGDIVDVVSEISTGLAKAQDGLETAAPPFDLQAVKRQHLDLYVNLHKTRNIDGARRAVFTQSDTDCAFGAWLQEDREHRAHAIDCHERYHQSVDRLAQPMADAADKARALQAFNESRRSFFDAVDGLYENDTASTVQCSGGEAAAPATADPVAVAALAREHGSETIVVLPGPKSVNAQHRESAAKEPGRNADIAS